eukprot:TRINITY_DN7500_c0_g1_i1.p1 TRINITY_DN7500_c0_g1~~TRINITY_DN7500_c0_g1_i1.p1  ORF type:complete len:345 (-),score=62.01 TRINITY_DN7500_c0_g1_i1:119-1153(-)
MDESVSSSATESDDTPINTFSVYTDDPVDFVKQESPPQFEWQPGVSPSSSSSSYQVPARSSFHIASTSTSSSSSFQFHHHQSASFSTTFYNFNNGMPPPPPEHLQFVHAEASVSPASVPQAPMFGSEFFSSDPPDQHPPAITMEPAPPPPPSLMMTMMMNPADIISGVASAGGDGEDEEDLFRVDETKFVFSLEEAVNEMGLRPLDENRPEKVFAPLAKQYFYRNMECLGAFLDQRYNGTLLDVEKEYEDFKPTYGRKNKHRVFWTERVQPLVSVIGPQFHRLALVGSINGLTPEVTRKFYALLKLIGSLDDAEALSLLDACWRVSAIGECDPTCQLFPRPNPD